jgi:hypothetical protein
MKAPSEINEKSPIEKFVEKKGKSWNGKIYGGGASGYRIYVDGCECPIPKSRVAAQKEWERKRNTLLLAMEAAIDDSMSDLKKNGKEIV